MKLRPPKTADAAAIYELVTNSGVLDQNSRYLYLLLCRDFSETSVVAECSGQIVGFVTGYRRPESPEVLFVWQIGVSAEHRGRGIAKALLLHLLARVCVNGVCCLEATVADSNQASQRLFGSIGSAMSIAVQQVPGFEASLFGDSGHEPEPGIRIGPFSVDNVQSDNLQSDNLQFAGRSQSVRATPSLATPATGLTGEHCEHI